MEWALGQSLVAILVRGCTLWWLSGKAKDAEQIETEKNRRQTDQRLGQQEAQKEQADKAEEN
jgi:hypothetical protein